MSQIKKLGLAVESMSRHTSNEGYELFLALESAGYSLCGHGFSLPETDVREILTKYNPQVVVLQDPREWDVRPRDFRDPNARFLNVEALKYHPCLKLTILKDAHQQPHYHSMYADKMGINAHIIYYDERVVRRLAPWLGDSPVIRTYHSIDSTIVPTFTSRTGVCLLSGATSNAYPLRKRLSTAPPPGVTYLKHPGYHRNGTATPSFLQTLSKYRIAICTCSIYNYHLRKLMEATACGCIVITNLPKELPLPMVDENLIRVGDNITKEEMSSLIQDLASQWDFHKQRHFAEAAKKFYDYRAVGQRLSDDIDRLRGVENAISQWDTNSKRLPYTTP